MSEMSTGFKPIDAPLPKDDRYRSSTDTHAELTYPPNRVYGGVAVLRPHEKLAIVGAEVVISDIDDTALDDSGYRIHDGPDARFSLATKEIFLNAISSRIDHLQGELTALEENEPINVRDFARLISLLQIKTCLVVPSLTSENEISTFMERTSDRIKSILPDGHLIHQEFSSHLTDLFIHTGNEAYKSLLPSSGWEYRFADRSRCPLLWGKTLDLIENDSLSERTRAFVNELRSQTDENFKPLKALPTWSDLWKNFLSKYAGATSQEICTNICRNIQELFDIQLDPTVLNGRSTQIVLDNPTIFAQKVTLRDYYPEMALEFKYRGARFTLSTASPKQVIKTVLQNKLCIDENGRQIRVYDLYEDGTRQFNANKKTESGYSSDSYERVLRLMEIPPQTKGIIALGDSGGDYFAGRAVADLVIICVPSHVLKNIRTNDDEAKHNAMVEYANSFVLERAFTSDLKDENEHPEFYLNDDAFPISDEQRMFANDELFESYDGVKLVFVESWEQVCPLTSAEAITAGVDPDMTEEFFVKIINNETEASRIPVPQE